MEVFPLPWAFVAAFLRPEVTLRFLGPAFLVVTVFFDGFTGPPDRSAGWYSNPRGSALRSDGSLTLTATHTGWNISESGPKDVVLDAPIQSIITQARYEGPADGGLGLALRAGGYGGFGCGIGAQAQPLYL